MSDEAPKKVGRPAKALGKRQSYAFRMNDPVRAVVAAAAEANGRSLSEEIERRVEQSTAASTNENLRLECLKLAVTRAAMIGSRNACKLAQSYFDYVTMGTIPADPEVKPTMLNSLNGLNALSQLGQNYANQSAD